MTSYTSNIWKFFLKHNQSTFYANEKIKYNIPSHIEMHNDEEDKLIFPFSEESIYNFISDIMLYLIIIVFVITKITRFL